MKFSHLILITILTLVFTVSFSGSSYADTLFSNSFFINSSTVNIGGGQIYSPSFGLDTTVGQTAQGQFGEAGFVIKAGFQYVHPFTPFTFTISNLDINFGSLVPGTPSTATNILSVTTGSAYGYAVKTIADHALRIINGVTTIPNTNCDLASPCTITDASPWTDDARYGFGYSMTGDDVDTTDFVNSTYFRPFPMQGVDSPAIIMSRPGIATDSAAITTYKVNVSGSQAAGTYQNSIQYIAIPAF